jgi:hypothetical protein
VTIFFPRPIVSLYINNYTRAPKVLILFGTILRLVSTQRFWDCTYCVSLAKGHCTESMGSRLLDFAEILAQCREYHREQISNETNVGRLLGLTCGGIKMERPFLPMQRAWE